MLKLPQMTRYRDSHGQLGALTTDRGRPNPALVDGEDASRTQRDWENELNEAKCEIDVLKRALVASEAQIALLTAKMQQASVPIQPPLALAGLPPELIMEILKFTLTDSKEGTTSKSNQPSLTCSSKFARTCRRFYYIAAPLLFRDLDLDRILSQTNLFDSDRLDRLRFRGVLPHVRKLDLGTYSFYAMFGEPSEWHSTRIRFLRACPKLETLSVSLMSFEKDGMVNSLWNVIAGRDTIRHLHFQVSAKPSFVSSYANCLSRTTVSCAKPARSLESTLCDAERVLQFLTAPKVSTIREVWAVGRKTTQSSRQNARSEISRTTRRSVPSCTSPSNLLW